MTSNLFGIFTCGTITNITTVALLGAERVGLIANTAVEQALLERGLIPDDVVHDHFNNTKGRNDWRNCRVLFVKVAGKMQ